MKNKICMSAESKDSSVNVTPFLRICISLSTRNVYVYVCMYGNAGTIEKVTCEGGARVVFEGTSTSSGLSYAVTLNLLNDIDAEKTKIEIGARNVFLVVFKAERSEEGEGWGRLTMEKTGMRHVKVDWNKWKGAK